MSGADAGVTITVRTERSRSLAIAAALTGAVALGVDRALAQVEQDATATAPFASGALRASRYRITMLTNEFAAAVSAMQARNPKAEPSAMPAVDVAHGAGAVGFAADYAVPVHDGHHTRSGGFVPARPWLAEAAAANRRLISQAVGNSLAALVRG